MSQSEFARWQNVSPQRVNQWIRDQIIFRGYDKITKKIDVEIASEELKRNLDFGKRIDWEINFGKQKGKVF